MQAAFSAPAASEDSPSQIAAAISPEAIRAAKMILWKGFCSVHQMFQPAHIDNFRSRHPDGKVISHPEDISRALTGVGVRLERIGLEAGPLSQWLFEGLAKAGLPAICIETRHAKAFLKAQVNKTDRNDARGIAQMMRVNLYRPVHVKTLASQKHRTLLRSRKLLQEKALAIESDIRTLSRLLLMTRLAPKGLDLDPVFNEVREMLHREVDYETERHFTQTFAEKLKDDPRFVVPRVFGEYSSDRVLTTSYEHGHHVRDAAVQSLSQQRRDDLSRAFMELFCREFFRWHMVQSDPHFGNYRIRPGADGQDRIVLLDFGATRVFGHGFVDSYSEIVRGAIQSIDKGQTMAAQSLGMTPAVAMRQIVLPQAVVRMIPPLGNEFIALIKNSALVSLLTIHDVMHEGQKIISVSYRSLEVYLAIAVVYFVLTGTMTLVLRHFEQRLRLGGLMR